MNQGNNPLRDISNKTKMPKIILIGPLSLYKTSKNPAGRMHATLPILNLDHHNNLYWIHYLFKMNKELQCKWNFFIIPSDYVRIEGIILLHIGRIIWNDWFHSVK